MKEIENYESSINALVQQFVIKWYKELYKEEADDIDIDEALNSIIWNRTVWLWPVEINDLYFSIDDLYISLANNIPMYIVENYYNDSMQAHYDKKELWVNLFNYYKRSIHSKEELVKEYEADLKLSEDKVKKAKKILEDAINESVNKSS